MTTKDNDVLTTKVDEVTARQPGLREQLHAYREHRRNYDSLRRPERGPKDTSPAGQRTYVLR